MAKKIQDYYIKVGLPQLPNYKAIYRGFLHCIYNWWLDPGPAHPEDFATLLLDAPGIWTPWQSWGKTQSWKVGRKAWDVLGS